ncbi:response regulator [Streptomyces flavotricini]|uniref:Response regulator n=1 Tax=Streptomyces flavotricini TaxID=66888 RepID=A0ABS8EHZ7_9ACTN|nr:response regulator [Streptomyces flavotricini]MCC0100726.1 response regulator [Streptomyces flavotricini]
MTQDRGRVLIVDDDRTNRMMVTYKLEISGVHVVAAESGQEALSIMREESFDVVLLDILMPQMDGYTTLELMKGDPALRDTPVVMISQLDEIDSVIRCLELGAEDYLPKPLNSLLLMARIKAILLGKRLTEMQQDYDHQLGLLIEALKAARNRAFEPDSLQPIADRSDRLGECARAMQQVIPIVSRQTTSSGLTAPSPPAPSPTRDSARNPRTSAAPPKA